MAIAVAGLWTAPAMAGEVRLTPLLDARLRYEGVDQEGLAREADAVTLRMRSGIEAASGPFALLAEAEATLAVVERYNSNVNGRTLYPAVADPENVELNRLQLQYRGLSRTVVTVGRQRINLDDQRFVGAVGWRQNEQTFDAVRLESAALGPVTLDVTYSWADRTIWGVDSPVQSIGGDTVLANAAVKLGPVTAKGFAYLIDQDHPTRRQFSSQTYGGRVTAAFPLVAGAKLALVGSYARQSDYAGNLNDYEASYWLGEGTLSMKGLALTGGYEVLGASSGAAFTSFQTPLATLHKFQGWADKFLTTPGNGIRDAYASIGYTPARGGKPGPLSLLLVYHDFDSDRLSVDYGSEWNAQVTYKLSKRVGLLVKYADYDAQDFATDTRKLWLQVDYVL